MKSLQQLRHFFQQGQTATLDDSNSIERRVEAAKLLIPDVYVYASATIEDMVAKHNQWETQETLSLNDFGTHPRWYTGIITAFEGGKTVTLEDQEARKQFATYAHELFKEQLGSYSTAMPAYLSNVAKRITEYVNKTDPQRTATTVRKTAADIDAMCNRTVQPHENVPNEIEARLSNVVRFLFPVSPNCKYSDSKSDRDVSENYRGFDVELNKIREEVKFVLDVYSQAKRYTTSFQKVAQESMPLNRG